MTSARMDQCNAALQRIDISEWINFFLVSVDVAFVFSFCLITKLLLLFPKIYSFVPHENNGFLKRIY